MHICLIRNVTAGLAILIAAAAPGSAAAAAVDDSSITMTSPADIAQRRANLVAFLWGPGGMPTGKQPRLVQGNVSNPIVGVTFTNLLRVERLVISMDAGLAGCGKTSPMDEGGAVRGSFFVVLIARTGSRPLPFARSRRRAPLGACHRVMRAES